jgi:hypothetical protein
MFLRMQIRNLVVFFLRASRWITFVSIVHIPDPCPFTSRSEENRSPKEPPSPYPHLKSHSIETDTIAGTELVTRDTALAHSVPKAGRLTTYFVQQWSLCFLYKENVKCPSKLSVRTPLQMTSLPKST